MPALSDRKRLIGTLDWMLQVMCSHEDSNDDENIDEIADIKATIESTRYLNLREYIGKNRSMNDMLFTYSDRDFKQAVRMVKESFAKLFVLIKDDPVFKNCSRNKQCPVWIQLMVVLQRLGCDGNGAATGRIARMSGFSNGSVSKFTERVLHALLKHRQNFIKWPDVEERGRISMRMARDHGLPGAVAICDGTPVVLCQRPGIDGEVYWTRKSHYAFNCQLYCDDRKLIRYYQLGWPGTVYDANVFSKSRIAMYPHRYLSECQFIIGDAGYALMWFFCTPFRHPAAALPMNFVFNTLFSSARCMIEHVNGILKNRFGSLKGIRIQIKKKIDIKKVNDHVIACIMLHNMLTMWNDEWDDKEEPEDEDLLAIAAVGLLTISQTANELRIKVQTNLLNWYYSTQ